jgi:hypothetical protein
MRKRGAARVRREVRVRDGRPSYDRPVIHTDSRHRARCSAARLPAAQVFYASEFARCRELPKMNMREPVPHYAAICTSGTARIVDHRLSRASMSREDVYFIAITTRHTALPRLLLRFASSLPRSARRYQRSARYRRVDADASPKTTPPHLFTVALCLHVAVTIDVVIRIPVSPCYLTTRRRVR